MIFLTTSGASKSASEPTALEARDASPRVPTSEWLQGIWLMNATPDDTSRGRCNSGATDTYNSDGSIDTFDYRGRWKLEGDKLTETIVETFSGNIKVGTSWTIKIQRLGPNEGSAKDDTGWQPMLRCPLKTL